MTMLRQTPCAILAAGLLLSGCGASAQLGRTSSALAATAAPTSIDKKLFYDFPLKPFGDVRKTVDESSSLTAQYYANLSNDNGPGKNEWGIWVERSVGDFSHGHWLLNLENGKLERYFIHSDGGTYLDAPANGGNVLAYLSLLAELKDALQKVGSPANAIDYVAKVDAFIQSSTPAAVNWGYNDSSQITNADYLLHAPADILVDVFHSPKGLPMPSNQDVWFTKGRVTVGAGLGTVKIKLDKPNTDEDRSCYYIKVLPVGGDYTQKIASYDSCKQHSGT